jgi:hypothetical protein
MWYWIVTFFLIKTVSIPCPNHLEGCQIQHTRIDTVAVAELRYCIREYAVKKYEWNKRNYKYDYVRLDSAKIKDRQ